MSENITRKNVKGKCDLKCSYNFKYGTHSTFTSTNNGLFISLGIESNSSTSILFNAQKYNVTKVDIVTPSIHLFNGKQTDCEIIVRHHPVLGGNNFNVGIPIKVSTTMGAASSDIMEIIDKTSKYAPNDGENTTISISTFSLDSIIPSKPFYSYTDSDNSEDWIVYDITEAITVNESSITTLKTIISDFNITTKGNGLFYNSIGPNTIKNVGDGIYISCQPTGSSEEKTEVEYSKNKTVYDMSTLFNNSSFVIFMQAIIGVILFIALFYGINYLYGYMTGTGINAQGTLIPKNFNATNVNANINKLFSSLRK
jgi:carbonic anhydrase